MPRNRLIVLFCVFAAASTLWAQTGPEAPSPYNRLLAVDDPAIAMIQRLYDAAGMVLPAPVYPITAGQALEWLDRLEPPGGEAPGSAELALIVRLKRDLAGRSLIHEGTFSLDSSIQANPELYLETRGKSDPGGTQWEYGWKDRLPLASVDLETIWGPFFGVTDFDLRLEHNAIERSVNPPVVSNIPADGSYIDFEFPFRTDASLGGKGWNFTIARDRLNMGNGATGNLGISDSPDYYDFGRLQLWTTNLMYTGMMINLDATRGTIGAAYPSSTEFESHNLVAAKNAFVHRVDLNFWNKLHIGLSEGIMVGGINPSLKYFNPFIIFHNTFPWLDTPDFTSASSLFAGEVTVNPFRWLRLWGQYAQNEIQTAFKNAHYGSSSTSVPDAFSWLAGLEASFPLPGAGLRGGSGLLKSDEALPLYLRGGLEWVYNNPWMGVRENALNSWFSTRRLASNVPGSFQYVYAPIGYDLGPDSESLNLWLGAELYNLFDAKLSYEYRAQGEQTILSPYETGSDAVSLKTPTGTPQYTHIVGLAGTFWLLRNPNVGLQAELYWLRFINYAHFEGKDLSNFQFALALRFGL